MNRIIKPIPLAVVCLFSLCVASAPAESPAAEPHTYTAAVYFQVLPPTTPANESNPPTLTPEEITRIINRQTIFIRSDEVVTRILQSNEVQQDPHDPTQKGRWLTENATDPKEHFLQSLQITPVPNSDIFNLKFTASDPIEAARIVNAAARIYQDSLSNKQAIESTLRLEFLAKSVDLQQKAVRRLEDNLHDYCRTYHIDLTIPVSEIDVKVLTQISLDEVKAQQQALLTDTQFQSVKKQAKGDTITLSPETERFIETDPRVTALAQAKLQLDLDQAGLPEKAPPESAASIKRRLDVVTRQLAARRAELTAAAIAHIQQQAEADFNHAAAELAFLHKARQAKSLEVRDESTFLERGQSMTAELNVQKSILAKLSKQYATEKLQGPANHTPIRRYGGDALPPD